MSFAKGQHYLLKAKSGEVWVVYLENNTLLYKYYKPGYHIPPSPSALLDLPVLEYSAVLDLSDNIHLVCVTKAGELKYFVGRPGSSLNSAVLAEFDLKAQSLKQITLLLTAKRIHIFHLVSSTVNSYVWAVIHSFWNGREWKDQQIGEIIAGKKVPPYSVDKDSQDNIHVVFSSAHGGKVFEAQYKKFNKMYDLWSHTERIANMPDNTPEVFSLVDSIDSLHLITCGLTTRDNKLKISYCCRKEVSNNSSRWDPVITIHSPAQGAARPLLSLRDNKLYSLWREQSGYMYSRSEDRGSSWSYPAPVNLAGKSALITYDSNYPLEAGRIKIPLFPGTIGSTVGMVLHEEYQFIPPPAVPENTVFNSASSSGAGRALPRENKTAGQESVPAPAEDNKFPDPGDIPEMEDDLDREEIKPETADDVQAAGDKTVIGAAGVQPGETERSDNKRADMEAQLEDLKMENQLVCQTVEGIEEKITVLEQGLAEAKTTLEQGLAEIKTSLEQLRQQQEQLPAKDATKQLDDDLEEVKKTLQRLNEQYDQLQAQGDPQARETTAQLAGHLQEVKKTLERLNEQYDQLQAQGDLQARETMAQLGGDLQGVKNAQAGIERSLAELSKKNKSAKDTQAELEKTRGILSGEITSLSARMEGFQESLNLLVMQQDEAGQSIEKLVSYQKRTEGEIDKILLTNGAMATVIERDIKERIEKISKYGEESRQKAKEEAGQFKEELKGQQSELIRLAQDQADLKNSVALLVQELRREYAAAQVASQCKMEEQLQEIIAVLQENERHIASLEAYKKTFQEKTDGIKKEQENVYEELQRVRNRGFFERLFSG